MLSFIGPAGLEFLLQLVLDSRPGHVRPRTGSAVAAAFAWVDH